MGNYFLVLFCSRKNLPENYNEDLIIFLFQVLTLIITWKFNQEVSMKVGNMNEKILLIQVPNNYTSGIWFS